MSDLDLMRALSEAAAAMAAPDADPDVIERVLGSLPSHLGLPCTLRLTAAGMTVDWQSPPSPQHESFADALGHCVSLAVAVSHRTNAVLDSAGLVAELHRAVAAARWRNERIALAVFDVHGLTLGPGVDASQSLLGLGEVARSVVRHDDVVGHLGAGRLALLFPRAGTFEARAAFRRVRQALVSSEHAPAGLSCGAAGFAELEPDAPSESDLLAMALERQADARRRTAYIGPADPLRPLAS
jgi:GGDEF domain-containing protein